MAAVRVRTWWFDEKRTAICRSKHVIRDVAPIITRSPCNHVATKKVDPYAKFAIGNGACTCRFQRKRKFGVNIILCA